MAEIKRVAIVGAGPIGLSLAYFLQKGGVEVYLFEKDALKAGVIKKEGFTIKKLSEEIIKIPHVYTRPEDAPSDTGLNLIIFCTKAYHTQEAAIHFYRHFGKCFVLSAQNGIDTEQILAKIYGETHTLRMVINFAGNMVSPNAVNWSFFLPPNYVGAMEETASEVTNSFAETLTKAGLHTVSIPYFELLKHIWEKTILNSSLSGLCGIMKMTMKEVMERPHLVETVEQIIKEGVEVAEAEKIIFDPDIIRRDIRYLKKAGPHFPSLALDIINGRPTEIDFFNGKIVEYGKKNYVQTPMNLMIYNLVKAVSPSHTGEKTDVVPIPVLNDSLSSVKQVSISHSLDYFAGIDLGSSFTKIVITDEKNNICYKTTLKTIYRERENIQQVIDLLYNEFRIKMSCATGHGRKFFLNADISRTEIISAAKAANLILPGPKTIIDIGGEDTKVIKCDKNGAVENFILNDKCAAGTGAFVLDIAEKIGVSPSELNELAKNSNSKTPLNSFCTVFAKTEVMQWIYQGVPLQDISKGIYLSILSRILKMKIDVNLPVIVIGGLIAHHPFLQTLLKEHLKAELIVPENAQYMVAYGAALLAKDFYYLSKKQPIAE